MILVPRLSHALNEFGDACLRLSSSKTLPLLASKVSADAKSAFLYYLSRSSFPGCLPRPCLSPTMWLTYLRMTRCWGCTHTNNQPEPHRQFLDHHGLHQTRSISPIPRSNQCLFPLHLHGQVLWELPRPFRPTFTPTTILSLYRSQLPLLFNRPRSSHPPLNLFHSL